MKYTPKFQEILTKCDALADAGNAIEEIREFFKESVRNLSASERMNNLYMIRPKDSRDANHGRLMQFKFNGMQSHFDKNQTNRDIVLKMRQGGVTTYSCIKALDMILWQPGAQTAIMAHVLPTVKTIFRIIKTAFVAFQKDWGTLYPVTAKYDSVNELAINETEAVTRVCTETKGMTLDFLHLSEACFIPDSRISESLESVPQTGQVIMESTPDSADGLFYEMAVANTKNDLCPYKLHFFPWWFEYPQKKDLHFFKPADDFKPTDKEQLLIKQHDLTPEHIIWRRLKIAECGGDEGEFCRKYPEDPDTCFLSGSKSVFSPEILIALWRNERIPAFCGELIAN